MLPHPYVMDVRRPHVTVTESQRHAECKFYSSPRLQYWHSCYTFQSFRLLQKLCKDQGLKVHLSLQDLFQIDSEFNPESNSLYKPG